MFAKYLLPLVLLACGSCRTGATVELQPACGACRSGATVELQPILHHHQMAMRQLMNSYSISGRAARPAAALTGDEIDACFDYYSTAQNSVATKYNNEYLGCVKTAADSKSALSAQSAEQRADIVTSGTDICSQLNECQKDEDSLDFFKCTYSVTDSTLSGWYNISVQSEAIVSHLKVQYQRIDDDQAICTTEAKNEYVSGLSTVASNLNKCLSGEFVPPTGEVTTEAPVTDAPVTDEPVTDEPVTDAPVTDAPVTDAPVTDAPVTDAPVTDEPVTDETVTDAPVTDAPVTDEPVTDEPVTDAPVTDEPVTDEPVTDEPVTDAPVTDAPVTDEPVTDAPVTDAPTTDTTEAAPEVTTISPDLPEEDVWRYRPMSRMNMWNMMRRL